MDGATGSAGSAVSFQVFGKIVYCKQRKICFLENTVRAEINVLPVEKLKLDG